MLQRYEHQSSFSVSPERLFEWHARPGAFGRLLPPWQRASLPSPARALTSGSEVEFGLHKGPFVFRWRAQHRDVVQGRRFTDVQTRGPFRQWIHQHEFLPRNGSASSLRDRIDYELPAGVIGHWLAGASIRRDLERTFRFRHRILAEDLKLHEAFAHRPRLRVAITGASGLIGCALSDLLTTGGHDVLRLSRRPRHEGEVEWDPARGAGDSSALDGVDAGVHLAGENVGGRRWTTRQMERIRASRIAGTRWLVDALRQLNQPPRTFLSASAIGLYGDRGDEQ